MLLIVDEVSYANDPELGHLLSFGRVEGFEVEHQIKIETPPEGYAFATLGHEGTRRITIPPLAQFESFATDLAARAGCRVSQDVILRTLALSYIAERLKADAVVSPANSAFGPKSRGLLRSRVITVAEALATIGAHVRQREEVPLGGTPLIIQVRSEVYPLTAQVIIPGGQDWWSSCVSSSGAHRPHLIDYGQAVFSRIGQALRGRDGVHESMRTGSGRAAILDALYHFDVVLMSSVAALDALARVADEIFGLSSKPQDIAWQRDGWRQRLSTVAPRVAGVVGPATPLRAALGVITKVRNSIHGIPLDEYLSVEVGANSSSVEHRVMVSSELSQQLAKEGAIFGSLEPYGVFLGPNKPAFLNIAVFSERVLSWSIEIISDLMKAMLSENLMSPPQPLQLDGLHEAERFYCAALARVGEYPSESSTGLPASRSIHRQIMGSIHRHRSRST
jgi:hypothetical protein